MASQIPFKSFKVGCTFSIQIQGDERTH